MTTKVTKKKNKTNGKVVDGELREQEEYNSLIKNGSTEPLTAEPELFPDKPKSHSRSHPELKSAPPELPVKPGRRICISGFAEATRDQANKLPDDFEIWSLNRCHTFLKRWTRHFEVHEAELYTGKTGMREVDYIQTINKSKVPAYLLHMDPQFENGVQFPFDEICNYFGLRMTNQDRFEYFTTSIAYMLALVLYEHEVLGEEVGELMICGVDMSAFSEYSEQLPCVDFWLGAIFGARINLTIPVASPLLKSAGTYGRHSERQLWAMAKERIEMYQNKQSQGQANMSALEGATSEYNFVLETLQNRLKKWEDAKTQQKPDESGEEFFGIIGTKEDGTVTWEELSDAVAEIKQTIEHFKSRRKDIEKFHAQVNADLNSTLGGFREAQHWLTSINAPQTTDQEPTPVKTVNI